MLYNATVSPAIIRVCNLTPFVNLLMLTFTFLWIICGLISLSKWAVCQSYGSCWYRWTWLNLFCKKHTKIKLPSINLSFNQLDGTHIFLGWSLFSDSPFHLFICIKKVSSQTRFVLWIDKNQSVNGSGKTYHWISIAYPPSLIVQ